jgi:small neutral amino acid transporter SnatA (MarC family)
MKKLFDGSVSWRSILTAECGILFGIAFLGNQITTVFKEAPMSYLIIIGGVFGFYFGKKMLEFAVKKPQTPPEE